MEPPGHGERAPWYPCACCPPNLMRLLSSWQQYLATSDDTGVQLHQYATARPPGRRRRRTGPAGRPDRLSVAGPGHGPDRRVARRAVDAVPAGAGWCRSATLTGPGGAGPLAAGPGTAELSRRWKAGRHGRPGPRPAGPRHRARPAGRRRARLRRRRARARSSTASSRPTCRPEAELEELRWDPGREPVEVPRPDLGEGVVGISVPVGRRGRPTGRGPARSRTSPGPTGGPGAMRVWIPPLIPGGGSAPAVARSSPGRSGRA